MDIRYQQAPPSTLTQKYGNDIASNENASEVSRYNTLFQRFSTSRQKWAKRFYDYEQLVANDVEGTGTQLTQDQLNEISKKYGIPLTANILVAIIEQMQAFLTANEAVVNVIPIGESSKHFAYVWRELTTAAMRLSRFKTQKKKAIKDMLIGGLGVYKVEPNDYYCYNDFNVNIKRIRWDEVFIDNLSEIETFQDSEAIFHVKKMTRGKAMKLYNLTKQEVEYASLAIEGDPTGTAAITGSPMAKQGGTSFEDALINIKEIYEKTQATVFILPDGTRSTVEPPLVDVNGVYHEGFIAKFQGIFVKKCLQLGNVLLGKEIMPISYYPFGFYVHTYADSPNVYGVVHHIADVIAALNKALALTVENAQKGSNYGTISPIGAIVDQEQWEISGSTPGANQEYNPDYNLPNGGAPILRQPMPLSNAWFTFYKELVKLVEYITGIFDLMQGNAEQAPKTLGATTSLQNFGTQRIKMLARGLDETDELLLDLVIEFMQAYSPKGNITRYLNDTDAMIEIKSDIEGTVMQNAQGTERFEPLQGGADTATLVTNLATEETAAIIGQLKLGTYKVAYNSSSNLPTTRAAALQVITEVMAHIGNEALAIELLEQALKLMDMPQIDGALRNAKLSVQQAQQIAQMGQKIEELVKDNEKLQGKLENSIEREKILEIEVKVAKEAGKIEQKIKNFDEKSAEYSSEQKRKQREKERVKDYA